MARRAEEIALSRPPPPLAARRPSRIHRDQGPTVRIRNLDVWDETRGGAKVLNMHWASDGTIEVVSFRRGDWEQVILDRAERALD
jgi:hypothetical protein